MMVHMLKAKNMETENLHGLIIVLTLVNSTTIIYMEEVFMSGLMEEYTQENGEITKWKVMVHLHGLMEGSM